MPRDPNSSMFGVKDIFTSINVLGGVVALCLCVDGRPREAGLAVLLGYLLGDALDGWVARKLGTQNQFGAEYDTIADHGSHVIAPAAIVFTVYRDAPMGLPPRVAWVLAAALAASIVVSCSIRHARNIVRPINYTGIWSGLPRSVLGFLALTFVNSAVLPHVPGGYWLGVVLIPLLGVATLTNLPFPNHRMARRHFAHVRILIVLFFVTIFGALAWRPQLFFDVFFFWMAGYSATAWLSLTAAERRDYREAVRRAAAPQTHNNEA
jgi:phosphatidylserine synthase